MRNIWSASAVAAGRGAPPREMLFKRDRPRAIDRYIDYFGDSGTQQAAREIVVDDLLLEASA